MPSYTLYIAYIKLFYAICSVYSILGLPAQTKPEEPMTTLENFTLKTTDQNQWINITNQVQRIVAGSRIREGICVVFVPHTTAAVTINENADPDVPRDMILALNRVSPDRAEFRHGEGNSAAHAKTSLVGPSITLIVTGGRLLLGTWQGIWFNEYDGGRTRKVHVRVMGEGNTP
jgi:secondary thiamine-phosphate synthase enzyme